MESINIIFCFVVAAVIASTLNIISLYQYTSVKKECMYLEDKINSKKDIYIDI